jgi:hypothetical protein
LLDVVLNCQENEDRAAMTSLHIVELEAALNRCRAAMLPTPLVLAHFNCLATLYGTMIYERRQVVALADLSENTRHAALAYMAPAVSSTAGVVAAAVAPGGGDVDASRVDVATTPGVAEGLRPAQPAAEAACAVTAGTA